MSLNANRSTDTVTDRLRYLRDPVSRRLVHLEIEAECQ